MPPIPFPTPMVGLAVTPKSRGDEGKLSGALQKICEEDSTFRRDRDPQTKEMVITGMSELHLQILRERLKRRDKVEVDTKRAEDPLSRNDPGQRRGQLSPQEADRRPRPVRRSPHPHVPAAEGRERRGMGHQGPLPLDEGVPLRRGEQLPLGRLDRRRHDSQQLPAGRRKGLPRADRSAA